MVRDHPILNILLTEVFKRLDAEIVDIAQESIHESESIEESSSFHHEVLGDLCSEQLILYSCISELLNSTGTGGRNGGAVRHLFNSHKRLLDKINGDAIHMLGQMQDHSNQVDAAKRYAELLAQIQKETKSHYKRARTISGKTKYFISYAHPDEGRHHIADMIELLLLREGRLVWRDENIRSGGGIDEEIVAQIKHVDTFIAVNNNSYSQSDWCKGEVEHALEQKNADNRYRIITAKADNSSLPTPLKHRLAKPCTDFSECVAFVNEIVNTEK